MKIRYLILTIILGLFLTFSFRAIAQEQKCEGPPQVCQQILELQKQIQLQKDLKIQVEKKDTQSISEARVQGMAMDDSEKEKRMGRILAAAAMTSVILKLLISSLTSWRGYFKTDIQKAWLKVSLVGFGFLTFLLTNIGYGIPWWQAVVLAGAGPGSIALHEITKLFPVLRGKKKLADAEKEAAAEKLENEEESAERPDA